MALGHIEPYGVTTLNKKYRKHTQTILKYKNSIQMYSIMYKTCKIYTKYQAAAARTGPEPPGCRHLAAAWYFVYIFYILYVFVYICMYLDIFLLFFVA